MKSSSRIFENFSLYAVTDLKGDSAGIIRKIESVYRGGADIVQLRSHCLTDSQMLRIGEKVKKIARRYRRLFFINDRLDLAIALGADGLHLGQNDMPLPLARMIAGRAGCRFKFGRSTCCLKQARTAIREGADYIGVGPVFETPTKPGRTPVGLEYVRQAARYVQIPWVAIGGIDLGNLALVMSAGAKRVAVVRAIFSARNPERATRTFKQKLGD